MFLWDFFKFCFEVSFLYMGFYNVFMGWYAVVSLLTDSRIRFLMGFVIVAVILAIVLILIEMSLKEKEKKEDEKIIQTPGDRIKIYINSDKSLEDKLAFIDKTAKEFFRDMYGFVESSSYNFLIKNLKSNGGRNVEVEFCEKMFETFYSKKNLTKNMISLLGKMLIEIEANRTVSDKKESKERKIEVNLAKKVADSVLGVSKTKKPSKDELNVVKKGVLGEAVSEGKETLVLSDKVGSKKKGAEMEGKVSRVSRVDKEDDYEVVREEKKRLKREAFWKKEAAKKKRREEKKRIRARDIQIAKEKNKHDLILRKRLEKSREKKMNEVFDKRSLEKKNKDKEKRLAEKKKVAKLKMELKEERKKRREEKRSLSLSLALERDKEKDVMKDKERLQRLEQDRMIEEQKEREQRVMKEKKDAEDEIDKIYMDREKERENLRRLDMERRNKQNRVDETERKMRKRWMTAEEDKKVKDIDNESEGIAERIVRLGRDRFISDGGF